LKKWQSKDYSDEELLLYQKLIAKTNNHQITRTTHMQRSAVHILSRTSIPDNLMATEFVTSTPSFLYKPEYKEITHEPR
jgi:hypothetical protein